MAVGKGTGARWGDMTVLFDLLKNGGFITWIICVLAVLSLYLVFERWISLHRAHINVQEFLSGICNVLKKNNVVEAIALCQETPGPVSHVVRAAIQHGDQAPHEIRRAIEEAGLAEIPRLEKNLKLLLTIVQLAPVCGLLGTVLGMMDLFQSMETAKTFIDIKTMAHLLWPALISTATGLLLAIPGYGFYMFFMQKVEQEILDMEFAACEIIYFLTHNRISQPSGEQKAHADIPG